jgi:hypothetical protein
MRRSISTTILLALVGPIFAACSESPVQAVKAAAIRVVDDPKELTRERAKKLIREAMFPRKITRPLRIGKKGAWLEQKVDDVYQAEYEGQYQMMADAGLLTITREEVARQYDRVARFDVQLTPKGKEWVGQSNSISDQLDLRNFGFEIAHVIVCDARIQEVTGIKFDAAKTKAIVEYDWFEDNVVWDEKDGGPRSGGDALPFAGFFRQPDCVGQRTTRKGEAALQLYDDGWRVVRNPDMNFLMNF